MTQRTLAGLMAVLMLAALVVFTMYKPLPYVSYEPGSTFDVLGKTDGKHIIEVSGHPAYRDDGELRMTTVLVSTVEARLDLFTLVTDWLDPRSDVYPFSAVYQPDETADESLQQGQAQMVTSQEAATAVAQEELGYDVVQIKVAQVTDGAPADGHLRKGDVLLRVGGREINSQADVQAAVTQAPAGEPLEFVVRRGGKDGREVTTSVTPAVVDGHQIVGITLGVDFDWPFDVHVNVSPNIGGPSAGLMFSLGIYDTVTPGSLTGGQVIAGTGTIDVDGKVGPIGGIIQKIAGARSDGAELFLVPADNCGEALEARPGDMRLVKAVTMHAAARAIEAWVQNPDADLPTCTADQARKADG